MRILAIDTTSRAGSVALLEDTEVRAAVSAEEDEPYSTRLFRDVDVVLQRAALATGLAGIDLYAVASGPGSFTGVRVGLAAVKAWAEVYGKPVAAVSALEAIAEQAPEHEQLVAAVSDAHRGQFFAGLYERGAEGLRRIDDDVVMPPEECMAYLGALGSGRVPAIYTTAPALVAPAVAASALRGARVEAVSRVLAPFVGRVGHAHARRGELCNAATLDAHYVRRSDAELLWKGR
jgi:tRNA threonylcarbamoyladenosine biosynthesis protein TsaB